MPAFFVWIRSRIPRFNRGVQWACSAPRLSIRSRHRRSVLSGASARNNANTHETTRTIIHHGTMANVTHKNEHEWTLLKMHTLWFTTVRWRSHLGLRKRQELNGRHKQNDWKSRHPWVALLFSQENHQELCHRPESLYTVADHRIRTCNIPPPFKNGKRRSRCQFVLAWWTLYLFCKVHCLAKIDKRFQNCTRPEHLSLLRNASCSRSCLMNSRITYETVLIASQRGGFSSSCVWQDVISFCKFWQWCWLDMHHHTYDISWVLTRVYATTNCTISPRLQYTGTP